MKVVRSFEAVAETSGRELIGTAYHFNKVSRVSDDGKTTYLESYAPSTGQGQPVVPLLLAHPWREDAKLEARTQEPFGQVEFTATDEGLDFSAMVSDDELGAAYLKMLAAGAFSRGVSIGAEILKSHNERNVVVRDAIDIFELSTLMNGQRPALSGAQISVVRNAIETIPSRLIRHRLKLSLLQ